MKDSEEIVLVRISSLSLSLSETAALTQVTRNNIVASEGEAYPYGSFSEV